MSWRCFNRRRDYMRNPYLGDKRVSIGSCEIPGGLTRAIYHARSVFAYVVGEPRRSCPPRHHIVECLLKFACLRIRGCSLSLSFSFTPVPPASPAGPTFVHTRRSPSELGEPSLFLSLRSSSLQTSPTNACELLFETNDARDMNSCAGLNWSFRGTRRSAALVIAGLPDAERGPSIFYSVRLRCRENVRRPVNSVTRRCCIWFSSDAFIRPLFAREWSDERAMN